MSVAASSLITAAQFKTYLGPEYSGTGNDSLFELLIDSVSEMFNSRIGRTLAKTTYTDQYFDGNGKTDLFLPNYPVISITSIYEDGVLLTEGAAADYVVDHASGIVHRVGGVWLRGRQTVKITYAAGYVVQGASPGTGETALPADLKLGCMIQVAREWKKSQGSEWGETSRSFPDGSTSHVERGLLKEVEEILQKYRRYRV
ncbi:MAG: hypothetical protein ABFD52_08850 [Acidobacteriota bacterium]